MTKTLESRSPADPTDLLGRFEVADEGAVDGAVARARRASGGWSAAGFEARAAVLRRFRDRARARQHELGRLIAREVGKAGWEAQQEAGLVPAKVDVTLGEGMRFVAPLEAGPAARATVHPRGVLAVLGPFNFPAHLPNGHLVPALALGNTVVFKPSPLAPAVGAFLVELAREAGLPAGVVELVQGGGDTGRTLALHPGVDGVLLTGSWAAGRALAQATLDQPGKILALEMGGKNAMIVLEDADLALAVAEAAVSIAATTGQRCTALSRLFVARSVLEPFVERLARVLRGLRVGMPLDEGVFMGPLISQEAFERVLRDRSGAVEAGGEVILDVDCGRPAPWVGARLVCFDGTAQVHRYQRDELFAPEAALYPVDGLDEAISAVNDSDFGLAASVMTLDRRRYEHCVGRIRTGILNWNRGTVGASGRLPFGGLGRSGNDRPAGILAGLYCSFPQAHLEYEGPLDPGGLPPGVPTP
jgi:succinylglutamic semialdehyde dehydrogenase